MKQPEIWYCPRGCGYRREYHVDDEISRKIIDHPVWGLVRNWLGAQLDIQNHSCKDHHTALARIRRLHDFLDSHTSASIDG